MFNLEQAIIEWRKRMLAAGIKTPEPLEELVAHLREDIAQQIKTGVAEREAFEAAVRKIGEPGLLRTEFAKTGELHDFLSQRRTLRISLSVNGALGLAWLWWSSPLLVKDCIEMLTRHEFGAKSWLAFFILLSAVAGGVSLVLNSKVGRNIIRTGALFWLGMIAFQDCFFAYLSKYENISISHGSLLAEQGIFLAFCLVSILILHLPEKANLKTTVTL